MLDRIKSSILLAEVEGRSKGKPIDRRSGNRRSRSPQKLDASLQVSWRPSGWSSCKFLLYLSAMLESTPILSNLRWKCHYPVQVVVRQHDEDLELHAAFSTFGYKHVLWPTAPAEVEGSKIVLLRVLALHGQVTEGLLKWYGHGRFSWIAPNSVLAGVYWKKKNDW